MSAVDLGALSAEIKTCRICRDAPRYGPALPHEPNPVCILSSTARIAICGQAPGIRVHNSGIPFNDPSGDRLREWLGVDRTTFYDPGKFAIVPMGFCFPGYDAHGSDLPPRRECRETWHERVFRSMPQLELILTIGQYAQAYHLRDRRRRGMTATVLNWQDYFVASTSPAILPLPHPSWRNSGWLKKNPWFADNVLPALREKVRILT
ncbi:uracil-DNA glycosylase family protein [Phyllobacterium sp. BT25]|uniref:Uracil-DNA glycosylase family protein n=1 Tax=Phyllobacterium pellucidum TaxID=2740464 RepID=A0A849VU77_9HYPH|nr:MULTISPECIES: uracil-DNA glycosylase family protein [Phyllobacterium]NTS31580.1 uracil-DNA glycosylase family protein [Phyllobacterium pellucidum]SFI98649.1 Uracil-DNA glycosylase [Phyllobacterium sp. CL33Tsu]